MYKQIWRSGIHWGGRIARDRQARIVPAKAPGVALFSLKVQMCVAVDREGSGYGGCLGSL